MKRSAALLRPLLSVGILALLLLLVGGGIAAAADTSTQPTISGSAPVDACGVPLTKVDAGYGDPESAADSSFLSINRWGSVATGFHNRLDADAWNDLMPKLQRDVMYNTMISAGNSMWQGSTALTAFATRFCLMDTLGAKADKIAAGFGDALFKGGLVTFIVVGGFGALVWRSRRGGGAMKGLGQMLGTLIIMAVLLAGASGQMGTKGGIGNFGPAWFGSTVNTTIGTLSSLPSNAVSAAGSQLERDGFTKTGSNVDNIALTCANETMNLRALYAAQYGPSGMQQMAASIPLTMSQMWENTGLSVWVQSQFGSANEFGPQVYCHVLEDRLNTPRWRADNATVTPLMAGNEPSKADQSTVSQMGLLLWRPGNGSKYCSPPANCSQDIPAGLNGDSLAWDYGADNKIMDVSIVGWAACRWVNGAWKVDPQWEKVKSGGDSGGGDGAGVDTAKEAVSAEDCESWWGKKLSDQDVDAVNMNYEDNAGFIRSTTSSVQQPKVGNFLLNWHGNDNGAAFTLSASYVIAALMMLIIFGGISLGIIIAKVAMIVLIALVFLAAIVSLWPGAGTSRLTNYAKFYLGTALFTFGISVIFSLITLVTGFLAEAGVGQFGSGTILATLWTGFSPVAAVVVLNMIFKHGLRMPSPLKPGAALAFGAAIGGIGAAAGAGVESMFNRAKNKGQNQFRGMRNSRAFGRSMQQAAGLNAGKQKMTPKDDLNTMAAAGAGTPGSMGASSTAAGTATAPPAGTDPTAGGPGVGNPDPLGAPAAGELDAGAAEAQAATNARLDAADPSEAETAAQVAASASNGAPSSNTDGGAVVGAALPGGSNGSPVSETARRTAALNAARAAKLVHRTGGTPLQTGRLAGWHRRTNSKITGWVGEASTKGRFAGRAAAAGAALAGVAAVRGSAAVMDNAQQRVVRRASAGWSNADLYNRGKDRARLAMTSMRHKPLRTAALAAAGALTVANPGMLVPIAALAAFKGYNAVRPKDGSGRRQGPLKRYRQNAPLRRSTREQAHMQSWALHQAANSPSVAGGSATNGAADQMAGALVGEGAVGNPAHTNGARVSDVQADMGVVDGRSGEWVAGSASAVTETNGQPTRSAPAVAPVVTRAPDRGRPTPSVPGHGTGAEAPVLGPIAGPPRPTGQRPTLDVPAQDAPASNSAHDNGAATPSGPAVHSSTEQRPAVRTPATNGAPAKTPRQTPGRAAPVPAVTRAAPRPASIPKPVRRPETAAKAAPVSPTPPPRPAPAVQSKPVTKRSGPGRVRSTASPAQRASRAPSPLTVPATNPQNRTAPPTAPVLAPRAPHGGKSSRG